MMENKNTICKMQDCYNHARCKGYCYKHYNMVFYYRRGDGSNLKNLVVEEKA